MIQTTSVRVYSIAGTAAFVRAAVISGTLNIRGTAAFVRDAEKSVTRSIRGMAAFVRDAVISVTLNTRGTAVFVHDAEQESMIGSMADVNIAINTAPTYGNVMTTQGYT